jgi:hypothetical protein
MKLLDWKILELLSEDFMYIPRPAHWYSILTVLGRHPAAELERSMNRDGASGSNPRVRSECGNGLCGKPSKRSVGGLKNLVPDAYRRMSLGARSKQDREKL